MRKNSTFFFFLNFFFHGTTDNDQKRTNTNRKLLLTVFTILIKGKSFLKKNYLHRKYPSWKAVNKFHDFRLLVVWYCTRFALISGNQNAYSRGRCFLYLLGSSGFHGLASEVQLYSVQSVCLQDENNIQHHDIFSRMHQSFHLFFHEQKFSRKAHQVLGKVRLQKKGRVAENTEQFRVRKISSQVAFLPGQFRRATQSSKNLRILFVLRDENDRFRIRVERSDSIWIRTKSVLVTLVTRKVVESCVTFDANANLYGN